MSSTAQSPGESLVTGVPSSPTAGQSAVIITREFSAARPVPLKNTVSLASLIERYEQDPETARDLAEARKGLSKAVYGGEASKTLSALRLAAGLSQAQLAEKAGTSQSHIARIERGQNDPTTDVIARIAVALGADGASVFSAILNERRLRSDQGD